VNWQMLSPNEPLPPDFTYKIPADLRNAVSYTTLKVLEGGNIPTLVSDEIDDMLRVDKGAAAPEEDDESFSECESTDNQLLDKILSRPLVKPKDEQERKTLYEKPSLDISLSHVRFAKLKMAPPDYSVSHYRFPFIATFGSIAQFRLICHPQFPTAWTSTICQTCKTSHSLSPKRQSNGNSFFYFTCGRRHGQNKQNKIGNTNKERSLWGVKLNLKFVSLSSSLSYRDAVAAAVATGWQSDSHRYQRVA
jgi:hypothetical protein